MGTIGYLKQTWIILIVLCILIEPFNCKRGGGGFSMGRGSSGARAGSAGRGSSGSRSSGGIFGGGSRAGTNTGTNYGGGTGTNSNKGTADIGWKPSITGGNTGSKDIGWDPKVISGAGNHPKGVAIGAGSGAGRTGVSSDYGRSKGQSGWGQSSSHKYTKGSGIGSVMRSNQFKNAIVGAAAGYLIYQGGKHMIRSAMAPMMWNNRQYYWGQSYYQSRPGHQMCRMPIESADEQFGNVYFQDNTRPREIVWSCGYGEVCCGTECCRVNGGSGWGYGGFGLGSLIILLLFCCCGFFLMRKYCMNRENNRWGNKTQYSQGEAQYTTSGPPPPVYPMPPPQNYPMPPPQNYYS